MNAVVKHVRGLWPGAGILSVLPFVVWPLVSFALGGFRWDVLAVMLIVPSLALATRATKKLYVGLYPIGLVGIIYDSMRFWKNVGVSPERVHIADIRAIDMRLFGFTIDGQRETIHDWFRTHESTFLDLYCAIPYGTFILVAFAFAVYLYVADYPRMQRFCWNFLLMNVVGFTIYHLYPAAPPWYFHSHGLAVDLTVHASEGPNLAHVDQLLGVHYFAGLYGRSSDVFGAMPSLHVAYPLLIVLYGWPRFRLPLRIASSLFLASMAFAAVYLDHHWIVDVLAGAADATGGFLLVRYLAGLRDKRAKRDGHAASQGSAATSHARTLGVPG